MSIKTTDKSLLIISGMKLFPPSIIENILSDRIFRREHDINSDPIISFSENSNFKRSQLTTVVRQGFSGKEEELLVNDHNDKEWKLSIEHGDNKGCIRLSKDSESILSNIFWPLTPDSNERLSIFEEESLKVNLPNESKLFWQEILLKGPLSDDMIFEIQEDLAETPLRIIEKITQEIEERKKCEISSLVPKSLKYYERLVGRHEISKDISEYSENEGRNHIKELLSFDNLNGLSLSFLLSSHSSISLILDELNVDDKLLSSFYESISETSDLISKIGFLELGFNILDKHKWIEDNLINLTKVIFDNDSIEQYSLLSSLIALVDGEISRLRILKDKPPFYRRLASIAQASLIERTIIKEGVLIQNFKDWALEQRSIQFYCQSLLDLRLEPRWQPDYLIPEQLKSELIGRILSAVNNNSLNIHNSKLKDLIFGEKGSKLKESLGIYAFIPGPLEGNITPPCIPSEISGSVKNDLKNKPLNLDSLIGIVNSVLIWKLESSHTKLVLKALSDSNLQVIKNNNSDKVFFILKGLANFSSINRNPEISSELFNLFKKYRKYLNVEEQPQQFLAIGLLAAAAYEDLEGWSKYVGDWVTELAYLPISNDSAKTLYIWVKQISLFEPELYCTCGRALAILESLST